MQTVSALPVGVAGVFWLFFGIALLVTLYYTFAQLYHWLRYGFMYPVVWVVMPVYFIGVVVLIGGMLAGIATL
jgi:hypothetical protein